MIKINMVQINLLVCVESDLMISDSYRVEPIRSHVSGFDLNLDPGFSFPDWSCNQGQNLG